jgi:starch-binding outer membrane protein SusE/F
MKNVNKLLLLCFSLLALTSCSDDIQSTDRSPVANATAPVLLNPTGTFNAVLLKANETNLATSFVWNDAAYSGTTTVVNYVIELSKVGDNFASPVTVGTTTNRFKDISVGELNTAFLTAGLAPFVEQEAQVRIKSYVGTVGTGVAQTSNSFTIKATPYPSWPNWGIIGSATPTGWGSDSNFDYDLTTKLYSITMAMVVGEFKFRLDDAWTLNYGDDGNNLTMEANGSNIPITSAGTYKIVANFGSTASGGIQPLSYTITKL